MADTAVIIPTYNRDRYLASCLTAVLAQTRPPAEVLVVDDGSTDTTPEVVRSFGDRVSYMRKPNSGKAASLNLALRHTRAPLVWIVDDDDIVCRDALERLVGLLEKNPGTGFAYGRHMRFVEDAATGHQRDLGTGYWCSCAPERFLTATLEDFFAHQPGMVVRRSLYEQVGPFDESLNRSQDYEMLIRLARAGRCAATDEVVFQQRQHRGPRGRRTERLLADELTRRWIESDQKIFRRLHRQMSLEEFLPRGQPLAGDLARRSALVQRGVVMARRKLWTLAAADFEQASSLNCGPLTEEEESILRRAFSSKYGCAEVLRDREVAAALLALRYGPRGDRGVRSALARGLLWRVRDAALARRVTEAAGLAAFALRLSAAGRYAQTGSSELGGRVPK